MLAAILLVQAVLGAILAALLWRAEPSRVDGRFFALTALADVATTAIRSLYVLAGYDIADPATLTASMVCGFFVGYTSVEFAYSFPTGNRAPAALWVTVALASAAGVVLTLHPATRAFTVAHSSYYFFPIFLLTLGLLARNYRRASRELDVSGMRLVIFAFVFRWLSAEFCFVFAKRRSPELFHAALHFEATAAIFIGYLVMGYGVLRYHLFRVRGVVAEMVVSAAAVVATLGLLLLGIDVALVRIPPGVAQRVVLISLSLLPVGILAGWRWLKPAVEQAILDPIDPRRALSKNVLSQAMTDDLALGEGADALPAALIERAREALETITAGGRVAFVGGPASEPNIADALPNAIAEELTKMGGSHLDRRRGQGLGADVSSAIDALGADLLVPVRRGGQLFGALTVAGGQIDRETVQAAGALADHLALKLDNVRLAGQMLGLERKLEEARQLAALGSFAAAIAHDIRTPLTSIQMNIQMLRGKAKLPADDMESFDIALDELRRLNLGVSELLDYAKPIRLAAGPVELATLADDAARSVLPIYEERALSLQRDHETALPPVLGDPTRLRQVLINLLDNAAQASSPGGAVVLRTRRVDHASIALEVRDTGRGIASEHLPHIFDPFFTTRADGTGLGLAIALKLVRAHGGEIKVESAPGRGAVFTVVLPSAA